LKFAAQLPVVAQTETPASLAGERQQVCVPVVQYAYVPLSLEKSLLKGQKTPVLVLDVCSEGPHVLAPPSVDESVAALESVPVPASVDVSLPDASVPVLLSSPLLLLHAAIPTALEHVSTALLMNQPIVEIFMGGVLSIRHERSSDEIAGKIRPIRCAAAGLQTRQECRVMSSRSRSNLKLKLRFDPIDGCALRRHVNDQLPVRENVVRHRNVHGARSCCAVTDHDDARCRSRAARECKYVGILAAVLSPQFAVRAVDEGLRARAQVRELLHASLAHAEKSRRLSGASPPYIPNFVSLAGARVCLCAGRHPPVAQTNGDGDCNTTMNLRLTMAMLLLSCPSISISDDARAAAAAATIAQ
jgi:hypothetical protein